MSILKDGLTEKQKRLVNRRMKQFATPLTSSLPTNESGRVQVRLSSVGIRNRMFKRLLATAITDPMKADAALQNAFTARKQIGLVRGQYYREVVIGAGLHGLIYGINRDLPRRDVLFLEVGPRIGGSFGLYKKPVFYLNSRNRVEGSPIPGTPGPLNIIPGAIVQPGDLNGLEYQSQFEMGLAIRLNYLLQDFSILTESMNVEIKDTGKKRGRYLVKWGYAQSVRTNRIILATGIGLPDTASLTDGFLGTNVMTFQEFLLRVSNAAFPLRRYERVAVIGAQDSGAVTVEYLLGQGPNPGPVGFDFVEEIDWFGQPFTTKEQYEECTRSRYAGIGRYMPRANDDSYYYRVRPLPGTVLKIEIQEPGVFCIRYRDQLRKIKQVCNYDHVILATGFQDTTEDLIVPLVPSVLPLTAPVSVSGQPVAAKVTGHEIYKIGPCAQLEVTGEEIRQVPALRGIPANSAAVFRYAERTAALARSFAR